MAKKKVEQSKTHIPSTGNINYQLSKVPGKRGRPRKIMPEEKSILKSSNYSRVSFLNEQ